MSDAELTQDVDSQIDARYERNHEQGHTCERQDCTGEEGGGERTGTREFENQQLTAEHSFQEQSSCSTSASRGAPGWLCWQEARVLVQVLVLVLHSQHHAGLRVGACALVPRAFDDLARRLRGSRSISAFRGLTGTRTWYTLPGFTIMPEVEMPTATGPGWVPTPYWRL